MPAAFFEVTTWSGSETGNLEQVGLSPCQLKILLDTQVWKVIVPVLLILLGERDPEWIVLGQREKYGC